MPEYVCYILGNHHIRVTLSEELPDCPETIERYNPENGTFNRDASLLRRINDEMDIDKVSEDKFHRSAHLLRVQHSS